MKNSGSRYLVCWVSLTLGALAYWWWRDGYYAAEDVFAASWHYATALLAMYLGGLCGERGEFD